MLYVNNLTFLFIQQVIFCMHSSLPLIINWRQNNIQTNQQSMKIHDGSQNQVRNWAQGDIQLNHQRPEAIFNKSTAIGSSPSQFKTRSKQDLMGSLRKLGAFSSELQTDDERLIAKRLMQLEGQCKIIQWQFIRVNKVKAVFAMILLIITFFGLFVLKYSAKFRKLAFFQTVSQQQATHVFIKDNDKKFDIVKIQNVDNNAIFFFYKKLKYSVTNWNKKKPTPVAYQFQRNFSDCFSPERMSKGLSSEQVAQNKQKFGSNQHSVQTPSFPEYLLDVLTEPFFLLQYFFCFVFFLQGYAPFSYALLFFSLLTTSINYVMLYISYKKIKQIAQRTTQVKVIRDGKQINVDSKQLVPGDVYIPEQNNEVAADCIIASGDIYVNEANLTGESMPIGKFQIQYIEQIDISNTWIYEGSKIVQMKQGNTFAIVINTGFTTHRGRIVRKILNRTVKDPDMLRSTLIFVVEVVIVSMITFFATLYLQLVRDIDKLFVFFKFIDFLASSAPPPLPILFNLAYSFSLYRLGSKGISGTEPQKTVEGSRLKIFCFDKTGTLTRPDVKITKVLKIQSTPSDLKFINIIPQLGSQQNLLTWQCFACCHTTKIINNQLLGDQIDKQMFNFINAKMQNSMKKDIRIIIKSTPYMSGKSIQQSVSQTQQKNEKQTKQNACKVQSLLKMKKQENIEVLRINQFQSKFQSMSVLIRDVNRDKYYIFAKGSPQKLVENCKNIKSEAVLEMYNKKIRVFSFNGLRTICYGYRQVAKKQQIDYYIKCDREQYIKDLTVEGLICFENKLKSDTKQTIIRLNKSNIENKMITGDSLYIAAETARRAGIIGNKEKIVFLPGKYNNAFSVNGNQVNNRTFKGILIESKQQQIQSTQTQQVQQKWIQIPQNNEYLHSNYTFAIDNEFLTLDPAPYLSPKIKVFARIPPQNKALIIRRYKEQQNQKLKSTYSAIIRWLKIKNTKIGMCGDGANDLMALRQADLSVGIQATDASYGSSFNVKNLIDVDDIIKEAKCVQANIVHLYQYYGSTAMFLLCSSIIMITDTTYFSAGQLMYLNFCSILLTPVMISLSKPSSTQSEYVPDSNMMGINNHLVFWGNLLIPFFGVLGSWLYYSNTSDFIPNPQTKVSVQTNGFNSKNQATTLIYVLVLLTTACNGFITYRSKPWRQKIYTNYILTFLIIINLSLAFIFAFFNDKISDIFQFQFIAVWHMSICLAIMVGTLTISLIYNVFVESFGLQLKKLERQDSKQANQWN